MPENTVRPLSIAADRAPDRPGVYVMLAADTELLYIGKAGSLRRRLRQHARVRPGGRGYRLDVLYERVAEVRWEELPDEPAAAVREADLILALQPICNAGSHLDESIWNYVEVGPGARDGWTRFTLTRSRLEDAPSARRRYGCFPHLGRGVSSPPGIACSDGYVALLRLLWAASNTGRAMPSRITRSAPDDVEVPVDSTLLPALHAFLSGTSSRLLDQLESATGSGEDYLRLGLERDRKLAEGFYLHGPRALRKLRLRHGRSAGPMSKPVIERLLTTELRQAIGEFRVPTPPDGNDRALGRKANRWSR
jgi:predicted GIY-YIG superfamily endonuclease